MWAARPDSYGRVCCFVWASLEVTLLPAVYASVDLHRYAAFGSIDDHSDRA